MREENIQEEIKLLSDLTVLFAEDEDLIKDTIVPIFKKIFKNVIVANDGAEAYDYLLNDNEIDMIVSDYLMPKMNGIEFLEKTRELGNDIPFIFCSAINEQDMLIKAIELNAYGFIKKPVNMKYLLSELIYSAKELINKKENEEKTKEYQSKLKAQIFSRGKDVHKSNLKVQQLQSQVLTFENQDDVVKNNKKLRVKILELEDKINDLKKENNNLLKTNTLEIKTLEYKYNDELYNVIQKYELEIKNLNITIADINTKLESKINENKEQAEEIFKLKDIIAHS